MAQMRIKDIAAEAGVSPATISRYLQRHARGAFYQRRRARLLAHDGH